MSLHYPFSAIVGQETMKLALVLNAVNPRLGGVLIRGQKGTAKSTAARGLAALLPAIEVVEGCRFGCAPGESAQRCPDCAARGFPQHAHTRPADFVELPIGATEDRVIGSLDIERALSDAQRRFEPGVLARANRGLLYVDEVNLLPDHLVDTLLDAAAMGVNTVERDGVSFSHPASFVLVGTMNPEEGDLRPQLLDRFGLAVDVAATPDLVARADVVRRRIAFENDPAAFCTGWSAVEAAERARIQSARHVLPMVRLADALLELIARICTAFEVDGMRADLVTYRTAVTLAAYAGRTNVTIEDVRQAAELALAHRRRRQPFDDTGLDRDRLDSIVEEFRSDEDEPPAERDDEPPPPEEPPPGSGGAERTIAPETVGEVRLPEVPGVQRSTPLSQSASRRRTRAVESPRGRHVRSTPTRGGALDVLASLRAAAERQRSVQRSDLRYKVRVTPVGGLTVFVVDASGSMAARRRMALAKGAVISLLLRAYQTREEVALIAFRGERAEVVLPPTRSVQLASNCLRGLPTGGRTPLALALRRAGSVLGRHPRGPQRLVLVSDGRANVPLAGRDAYADALVEARQLRECGVQSVLVDTEDGRVRLGRGAALARELGAVHLALNDLVLPS